LQQHVVCRGLELGRLVGCRYFSSLLILRRDILFLPWRVMHMKSGEYALGHRAKIRRSLVTRLNRLTVGLARTLMRSRHLCTHLGLALPDAQRSQTVCIANAPGVLSRHACIVLVALKMGSPTVIAHLYLPHPLFVATLLSTTVVYDLVVHVETIVHARRHVTMSEVSSRETQIDGFDRIFHLAGCLLNRRRLLQVGQGQSGWSSGRAVSE